MPRDFGAGDDLVDDPAVAAMDAVEVADGGDDGAEAGGKLGEGAIDGHGPGEGRSGVGDRSWGAAVWRHEAGFRFIVRWFGLLRRAGGAVVFRGLAIWAMARVMGQSHGANLELYLQAIVGETDVRREDGLDGAVVEVVAHVGEEGAAGLEKLDERGWSFRGWSGWDGVLLAAEGIKDEEVEVLEEREALFGDLAHVGEVGGGAEAVAGDALLAVLDGDAAGSGLRRARRSAPASIGDAVELDAERWWRSGWQRWKV